MTVRVACPTCGDVLVTFKDISISQCADTEHATYQYRCPSCEKLIVTDIANRRIFDLLAVAGVPVSRWSLSVELQDADRCGLPITEAEVEAFAREMNPS